MKAVVLVLFCTLSSAKGSPDWGPHPAKEILDKMRKEIPKDVLNWIKDQDAKVPREAGVPHILVAGDSWADVVGGGGTVGQSFLTKRLKAHGCSATSSCIAIPGTTSDDWATAAFLTGLKAAAKLSDYIYFMLGGNDCLEKLPDCAHQKKSAAECGDEMVASCTTNIQKIVDAIHEVNPKARVVGFGYDTMFGAKGCGAITHDILPQCWSKTVAKGQGNRCFNTELVKIQATWDGLAANRSFVDKASILGATQVAGGDTKASTDPTNRHIDMDAMGPAQYWPLSMECFHPSVDNCGDNVTDCGATVVMEEFYKSYWSKQPNVCPSSNIVV